MLAAILLFSYYFWSSAVYGFALQAGLDRLLHRETSAKIPIPIAAIIGLIAISVLASTANLFLYLGFPFALLLFVGAVILHVRMKPFRTLRVPRLPFWVWLIAGLISLTVLEISTQRPSVSDTALYHAQTIRWFETYPAVPGLGNLHHRFAFNSSWLVLNAALSFSSFDVQSFRLVGGFFFLIAQLYFLGGLVELFQGNASWAGMFKVIAIPLSFYLFSSVVSSPAYDMPVAILAWIIVILWLEAAEDESRADAYLPVIFILAVYAVTVKLSAVPLLLFPAWIFSAHARKKEWNRIAALGSLAAVVLIPWMARSVVLSGYLVFPVSQLDLFSFDWKIPAAQVTEVRNGIVGFARLPGKDWADALSMPFSGWFPLWFENLTTNQKAIFVLAVVSPLLFALGRFTGFTRITSRNLFGFVALYAGLLFWFVSAPDVRFGYGFLAGADVFVVSFFLFILFRNPAPSQKYLSQFAFLALFLFQTYSLAFSFDSATFLERLVLPADYSRSRAESCDLKNATVFCRVEGGQCNYEKFPCIPSPRPNVEMRGPSFEDGFRDAGND